MAELQGPLEGFAERLAALAEALDRRQPLLRGRVPGDDAAEAENEEKEEKEEMYPSTPSEVPEWTDLDDPERLERAAEDSEEEGLWEAHGGPENRHRAKASVGYVQLGSLRRLKATAEDRPPAA